MNTYTPAPNSGFMVVTHVQPQQNAQNVTLHSTGTGPPKSPLERFLKGEPAVLGTVQIMIGVIVLLFGFVFVVYPSSVSILSGIMFWGGIIHITAGSLTVRASRKLSPCVVKASLGMNIVSTITALAAIILHIIDFVVALYPFVYHFCDDIRDYRFNSCMTNWEAFTSRSRGIAGVMLVLSLLEFIISIYVAAFGCRATCCTNSTAQMVYVTNPVPPSMPAAYASPPQLYPQQVYYPPSSEVPLLNPNTVSEAPVDDKSANLPPVYTAS